MNRFHAGARENALSLRFFQHLTNYPVTAMVSSLLLMALAVSGITGLTKDTRADAFLAQDNPALVYRDKVKDLFGLSDPMVIAVVNTGREGIFNPGTLALVETLTDKVLALDNINPDRVTSLATENNILGTDDGMDVTPFFDPVPATQSAAEHLRRAVADFPLYLGSLVARDGSATLIVAELENDDLAEATYIALTRLVNTTPTTAAEQLHVAGEGAIAGYLGSYIDSDANRLNPMAGLVITLIILLAFRSLAPALLANVIIAASVLMTLGIMAASGVSFFVITNALPVILIGISVADAIHIFSEYFDLQAKNPSADRRQLVVRALVHMWRPVTLTTLTTIAGFLGLYFASYMPPFKFMGLFSALGVAIAWLFSLVFLPAAMTLWQPKVSRHFILAEQSGRPDSFTRIMAWLGRLTLHNAGKTLAAAALIGAAGLYATSHLAVDEDRITTFHPSEPIYRADGIINQYLDGSNYLDIVIETENTEDLFEPAHLRRIERLQAYAQSLPYVQGSTSIVDYLKQMNRSLNEGAKAAYRLPQNRDLVAQYFLLYNASSDPTDFEEEVDYDYRLANVRLTLNSGAYADTRPVVDALQHYIDTEFNRAAASPATAIGANLSGRVYVNYHWIRDLGASHFTGLGIALLLVWGMSALLFRSLVAGLYAVLPVSSAILLIYSAMVALHIPLGIGTSMFASVAIGLGVDFSIHTLDRLRTLLKNRPHADLIDAMSKLYPNTGRALLFNFLAIACGFGILTSSQVVPLNNFGNIVALSVATSFLASMTLLPALVKVFRPRFIFGDGQTQTAPASAAGAAVAVLIGAAALGWQPQAQADPLPEANWIVEQINAVDDGQQVTRKLSMTLTDRRGKQRRRETFGYRKYFGTEKRTVLFYTTPSNVKGTGFLTYDYPDSAVDDDQWLYLPALRKVRRISASDRGDYFLGTDFTYEDIKKEGRIEAADYQFSTLARERLGDTDTYLVESVPVDAGTARELGYGRTRFWVDKSNWVVVKVDYWDIKGKHLKTLHAEDIRQVDGIWTRHRLTIQNHKTGHHTDFLFSEVNFEAAVKDDLFTRRALKRGR